MLPIIQLLKSMADNTESDPVKRAAQDLQVMDLIDKQISLLNARVSGKGSNEGKIVGSDLLQHLDLANPDTAANTFLHEIASHQERASKKLASVGGAVKPEATARDQTRDTIFMTQLSGIEHARSVDVHTVKTSQHNRDTFLKNLTGNTESMVTNSGFRKTHPLTDAGQAAVGAMTLPTADPTPSARTSWRSAAGNGGTRPGSSKPPAAGGAGTGEEAAASTTPSRRGRGA